MNQVVVPMGGSPALPQLVVVAGERAGACFFEFVAANIRNPHHAAGLLPGRRKISGIVCGCWCVVDRCRPAGASRDLD
jgi:hypothetical protein